MADKQGGKQGVKAEEPSGSKGDESATAGQGGTKVKSGTPENAEGQVNPSAPGETGTTPGTNG